MTWSRLCLWACGRTVLVLGVLVLWTPPAASAEYRIAFGSFGPVNTDIYIADSDGSEAELLVVHPSIDMNATFMPDGRAIVFTSYREGSADLYRIGLDGTGLARLTEHEAYDDQASVSPDGRLLAFVSDRTGQADVWILDLESGATRNLTRHPSGDFRPAWSPDGRWIAFSGSEGGFKDEAALHPPNIQPYGEIYVIRTDGTDRRRLTDNPFENATTAWVPLDVAPQDVEDRELSKWDFKD